MSEVFILLKSCPEFWGRGQLIQHQGCHSIREDPFSCLEVRQQGINLLFHKIPLRKSQLEVPWRLWLSAASPSTGKETPESCNFFWIFSRTYLRLVMGSKNVSKSSSIPVYRSIRKWTSADFKGAWSSITSDWNMLISQSRIIISRWCIPHRCEMAMKYQLNLQGSFCDCNNGGNRPQNSSHARHYA